jgi:hypothetical protein
MKREVRLGQYQYKMLFESVMNKEAYEGTLKEKMAEQESIRNERDKMHYSLRFWLL